MHVCSGKWADNATGLSIITLAKGGTTSAFVKFARKSLLVFQKHPMKDFTGSA